METKQNTSQVIVAVLTQDAVPRQPVLWTKDRRSVATELCIEESRDRSQQSIIRSPHIIKPSSVLQWQTIEQSQHGEQPYTAAGCGRSFSHKSVLKGQAFYTLSIVGNPVTCVMFSELSLWNLQCTDSMACSCFQAFLISVTPMQLFVSCADVLSTVGEPVVVVTPVWSPPGTDRLVSPWSLLFLFTWPSTVDIFPCPGDSLALWPRWVFRMSSWEVVMLVRRRDWDPRLMDSNSATA